MAFNDLKDLYVALPVTFFVQIYSYSKEDCSCAEKLFMG